MAEVIDIAKICKSCPASVVNDHIEAPKVLDRFFY